MKVFVLAMSLLLNTIVFAQSFQPGVKAGVNISNFTGGDFNTVKNKSLVGFHAGGLLRFKFGNLALQPEIVFSSQGAKLESAGDEENYKISYLNIPVLLQFETDGGVYFEAGPQVGFKLSEDIPESTIEDFAKSTDLSVAVGLGYHSKMGLGIGGRYNIGVSKVGEFDAANIDPNFKNGVIQLCLLHTLFNK